MSDADEFWNKLAVTGSAAGETAPRDGAAQGAVDAPSTGAPRSEDNTLVGININIPEFYTSYDWTVYHNISRDTRTPEAVTSLLPKDFISNQPVVSSGQITGNWDANPCVHIYKIEVTGASCTSAVPVGMTLSGISSDGVYANAHASSAPGLDASPKACNFVLPSAGVHYAEPRTVYHKKVYPAMRLDTNLTMDDINSSHVTMAKRGGGEDHYVVCYLDQTETVPPPPGIPNNTLYDNVVALIRAERGDGGADPVQATQFVKLPTAEENTRHMLVDERILRQAKERIRSAVVKPNEPTKLSDFRVTFARTDGRPFHVAENTGHKEEEMERRHSVVSMRVDLRLYVLLPQQIPAKYNMCNEQGIPQAFLDEV